MKLYLFIFLKMFSTIFFCNDDYDDDDNNNVKLHARFFFLFEKIINLHSVFFH